MVFYLRREKMKKKKGQKGGAMEEKVKKKKKLKCVRESLVSIIFNLFIKNYLTTLFEIKKLVW